MLQSFVRMLATAAHDWKPLTAAIEAGRLHPSASITPGIKAAVNLSRQENLAEALARLSTRDQVLAELVLSSRDRPEHLRRLAQNIQATAQMGEHADAGREALKILKEMPEDQRALRLDLADAESSYTHDWFNGPETESLLNPTMGDVMESLRPSSEAMQIGTGSGLSGRLTYGDVIAAYEGQRITRQADEVGLITRNTTAESLYGNPISQLGEEFKSRVQMASDVIRKGWSGVKARWMAPTLADFAFAAAPSSLADEIRSAETLLPPSTFGAHMVDRVAQGDKAAQSYLSGILKHSADFNETGGRGVRRPPDAGKVGGPPPPDGTPPTPPGRGGGRVHPWQLFTGAFNKGMQSFRWVEHVLPKEVYQPIRLASQKKHDLVRGLSDYLHPHFRGIAPGSPDAIHVGRVLDVTPSHFEWVDNKLDKLRRKASNLEKAIADVENLGGELAGSDLEGQLAQILEDIEKMERYGAWLRLQRMEMTNYDRTLSDVRRGELHAAAQAARRTFDTAGFMLKEADIPALETFGEAGGMPLGAYFMHLFPAMEDFRIYMSTIGPDALDLAPKVKDNAKFLLPRVGVPGYSYDVHRVLDNYFNALGDKLYLRPALKAIAPDPWPVAGDEAVAILKNLLGETRFGKHVGVDVNPLTAKLSGTQRVYLANWIKNILGHPSTADVWVSNFLSDMLAVAVRGEENARTAADRKFFAASRKILEGATSTSRPALKTALMLQNSAVYGTLGLNFGFAFKNSLQPITAIAERGVSPWFAGLQGFYGRGGWGRRLAKDMNWSREWERFLETNPEILSAMQEGGFRGMFKGMPKAQIAKQIHRSFADLVMTPGWATEFANRGITNLTGIFDSMARRGLKTYDEALRSGQWDDILREAKELDDKVNFVYGTMGMNPYLARSVARPFFLYTSYPYKMAEIFTGWVKNKQITPIIAYLSMTGAITSMLYRNGMDVSEWLGFPGAVRFNFSQSEAFPIRTVLSDAVGSAFTMFNPNQSPYEKDQAWERLKPALVTHVLPGYVGLSRAWRLAEMVRTGKLRNRHGIPYREYGGDTIETTGDVIELLRGRKDVDWGDVGQVMGLSPTVETSDVYKAQGAGAAENYQKSRFREQASGEIFKVLRRSVKKEPSPEEWRDIEERFSRIAAEAVEREIDVSDIFDAAYRRMDSEFAERGMFWWEKRLRSMNRRIYEQWHQKQRPAQDEMESTPPIRDGTWPAPPSE